MTPELCFIATDMASLLTECKHAIPRARWASSIQNRVAKTSLCWSYCVITTGIQQCLASE